MPRKCFLTHAWREPREVEYIGPDPDSEGYAIIFDPATVPIQRVVPVDSIYFKEVEEWDDLL